MRLTDLDKCDRKLFYKQAGGWDSLITAKAAFDMLDSLPVEELPVFKWIPVSERLPKGEMACLVYGKMHFIPDHVNEKDWFYDYSIGCFNPVVGWSTRGDMEVLAWMPLPKPYEGVSE